MSTLVLLLRGPMQSWGHDSRYTVRDTAQYPTKSGVLGLIAAAEGRRRSDPVEDLAMLRFGVRVDQPGVAMKDFQTAIDWERGKSMPLVSRYYLADAVFVAAIEGPKSTLKGIAQALKSPRYSLYLGRRSCPANYDIVRGLHDCSLEAALAQEEWHASSRDRENRPSTVDLPVFRDAHPGEHGTPLRDVPVSFSQEDRKYAWRVVVQEQFVTVDNPGGSEVADPFFETVISA